MKVLTVLTSHSVLGKTEQPIGFWLEEFAAPYYVFKDAGVAITIVSPNGGQPPIDPKNDRPENRNPGSSTAAAEELIKLVGAMSAAQDRAAAK
jgi:putative intracellular protease/amidase